MIPIDQLTTIAHVPGVYFFKNAHNIVIYIGKAKDLHTRVRSYFQKEHHDSKTASLVQEIASVDYLPTRTELEALLLEAALIAQEQPHYNMLLKDGQPFVYIVITQQELPELKIARNKKIKGTYFGPFIYKQEVRTIHSFLLRTFQLSLCNKKLAHGCLDYHIGICPGVCRPDFDSTAYLLRLELVKKLLHGKYTELFEQIEQQIRTYNKELQFEKSAHLNELRSSLNSIITVTRRHFDPKKFEVDALLRTAPVHHKPHKNGQLSTELQQLLGLSKEPHSIDCFDISHFQSQSLVGSCIRFVDGLPDKHNFRKFKIRSISEQNDYAALQEIVRRRYRNQDNLPDLILIDGGKGQRNAIKDIFPHLDCISIAKREERVFSDTYPEGIVLDPKTETGKTLIALRDYAHHFAISYHRKKQTLS